MLKILRPFWNTASLVCYNAPVTKSYRNNTFLMNGNDHNDGHQIEWNARFTEQINTCNVLFRGGGKKTWCFFFRQKSRRCSLGGSVWYLHILGFRCRKCTLTIPTSSRTGTVHPNQGTYVSPHHVTTSYGTWGGAVGTRQNNGLSLCKKLKLVSV